MRAAEQTLPQALKRTLPPELQEVYREEFDRVWHSLSAGSEPANQVAWQDQAHRQAWGKLKQLYYQTAAGEWRPRKGDER